jgi:hypothetical protein
VRVSIHPDDNKEESMKPFPSLNRRAFLSLGAGIAAGTSMAMSTESDKARHSDASDKASVAQVQKTLRPFGPLLSNHTQDTGFHLWNLERWKQEIGDSRRMGARAIWYVPFEFDQCTRQDFEDRAPHWILQRALCSAIVEAGLEVGIWMELNDIFPDTWNAHPDWHATRGRYILTDANVCPSVPEARKEMLRLRERLFAGLPRLDYVVTQISDGGGCGCDKCAPYPKTFMEVLEEQTAVAKRYHPEAKIVVSGLGVCRADSDMLRERLTKASWADFVYEFPRGPKPVIRALLYPETTMAGGWGKFGACPLLPYIKRGYEYDIVHLSGVAQYSEGIHDDVNRFAVLQFAQDPQRSVQDVARAYAEDWLKLSGRDAALAGEVIAGLGTEMVWDWPKGLDWGADNPHADDRVKILIDVRTRSRGLEDNFRYWLLHYRAVCESFSTASGPLSSEVLRKERDTARAALLRLEPEYGQFLASQYPWFNPGDLDMLWPRTSSAMVRHENSFL